MRLSDKLKNKKVMASVILIVLAVLLFGASFYFKPELKCGTSLAGKFYDNKACDKSCNSADDCKFNCACGAFNKNESCFSEGVEISCEKPAEIKCIDNECVALSEKEVCQREGGKWRTFNNGCVDNCEYRRNPEEVMCTQAFTKGCYCGEDRCWNSEKETCEDI